VKTCLQINHQIAHEEHSVCNDAQFAKSASSKFSALIDCCQHHDDRRCRILSCKTLAILARSSYARLRHSPLLYSTREGANILNRLEDEVGTDVAVALCNVALDDTDDGVASCAVESLGILTLSIDNNELLQEMKCITHGQPTHPHGLAFLVDEDASVPMMELSTRIYENVVSPRLWRMIQRILCFTSAYQQRTISFLTDCLVHLINNTSCQLFNMDRSTFAKRWMEVDVNGMAVDVMERVLLPLFQQPKQQVAYAAALSVLRLSGACPSHLSTPSACRSAALVLSERFKVSSKFTLEDRMMNTAALLIASRAMPLNERVKPLLVVLDQIATFPTTTRAPQGVVSAGIHNKPEMGYWRPARVSYCTELALAILSDDPLVSDDTEGAMIRSTVLQEFLKSQQVVSVLVERRKSSRGCSHVAEELVLAFCTVSSRIGREMLLPHARTLENLPDVEEWIRCSITILSSLARCLNWKPSSSEQEADANKNDDPDDDNKQSLYTLLICAQLSFVQLLLECLHVAAAISLTSSVSYGLLPLTCTPDLLLLQEFASNILSLTEFERMHGIDFAYKDLKRLSDRLLTDAVTNDIPSRHIRISMLAALTDQWVENCHNATRKPSKPSSSQRASPKDNEKTLNDSTARQLLLHLSDEISYLVNSGEIDQPERRHHYTRVCVACVENIALAALEWGRTLSTKKQDSALIVQAAVEALKGMGPGTDFTKGDVQLCEKAYRRIQHAVSHALDDKIAYGGGGKGLLSPLFADAVSPGHMYSYTVENQSPQATVDLSGTAYRNAYFAYCSRQVVDSRFCLSARSSPLTVVSVEGKGGVRRSVRRLDSLRLPTPILASARLVHSSGTGWENAVMVTGGSDPVAVLLAYSVRRYPRYDGEPEYRLHVAIRLTNTTAVEITKGVRLHLSVVQEGSEPTDTDFRKTFSALYKHPIRAGESVSWETSLGSKWRAVAMSLVPSVTFRDIEEVAMTEELIWADEEGDKITEEADGVAGTDNVADRKVSCDIVHLTPIDILQPCPLVFFQENSGDERVFRFLWAHMPFRLLPIELLESQSVLSVSKSGQILSRLSKILLHDQTKSSHVEGWAFTSFTGKQVLCVKTTSSPPIFCCRSDDADLMLSLFFTTDSKDGIVSCLTEGQWRSEEDCISLSSPK
jgi:hypothetical protein